MSFISPRDEFLRRWRRCYFAKIRSGNMFWIFTVPDFDIGVPDWAFNCLVLDEEEVIKGYEPVPISSE